MLPNRIGEAMPSQFDLDAHRMENGKLPTYAWPGGYPLFYVTADGGILCPKCANDNITLLTDPDDRQWYVIGVDTNYEDDTLQCDNCNQLIEAAYA